MSLDSPSLRFRRAAWDKLIYFRDKQDTEVSMFAITNKEDPLLVEDVQLVDQECGWATTEMSQEGIADLIDRLTDQGIPLQNISRIWCHTHPGESPDPSNTDEQTFAREFGTLNWAIMFILAKKGKMYCRFKQNTWPKLEMEIPVSVISAKYDRTQDDADFARLVKKKTYAPVNHGYTNHWNGQAAGGQSSTAPFHNKMDRSYNTQTPTSGGTTGVKTESSSTVILGFNRQPTKKERRYIAVHGSIDGFYHPKGCHMEPLKVLDPPIQPVKIEKLETERSLIPYVDQSETYNLDADYDDEDLRLDPVGLQQEIDDYEQSLGALQDEICKINLELACQLSPKYRLECQDYIRELYHEARDLRADIYEAKRLLRAALNVEEREATNEEVLKEAYSEYAEREGEEATTRDDDDPTDLELFPLEDATTQQWPDTIDQLT